MKWHRQRKRRKRVSGRAKCAAVLLALFASGAVVECVRMELGQSSVTVTAPFRPQYSVNDNPQSSIDLAASITGIAEFRNRYGTDGSGQRIALIDSGIDLSHEAFAANEDGTRKVAVYYDYTDEGSIFTKAVQAEQGAVVVGGTAYNVMGIYHNGAGFRMGFLQLNDLQPLSIDTDAEQLAVLVTAVGETYDCMYLDTNQNCDFTDEQPLYCYQTGGAYLTLYHGGYPMALTVSELTSDGEEVQITTDTLGHGTFLAGIAAANGTNYSGLAPQAQLYVYKIFDRHGNSSQLMLAQAIEQAVQDEVDCINLSLSIPKEDVVLPRLANALKLAEQEHIPVIAAAGNYGPGKNTIAYPAREASVIGVGSYVHPQQYLMDKAVMVEERFIADYSGRGTLDGSVAPLLAAPAGVLSSVPGWYQDNYMYDYGTSISAVMTTAAVSHLQEAMEWASVSEIKQVTTQQVKAILASWANTLPFSFSEQGYGALSMGVLPYQPEQIVQRTPRAEQPLVYRFSDSLYGEAESRKKELSWQFAVPQGQSQSWYLRVPDDVKTLEVSLLIGTEQPTSPFEHLIANGRCKLYLYNPDGKLVDATAYVGASYGVDIKTGERISVWHPQEGVWELVVTSADNLSQYNHWESTGFVQVTANL